MRLSIESDRMCCLTEDLRTVTSDYRPHRLYLSCRCRVLRASEQVFGAQRWHDRMIEAHVTAVNVDVRMFEHTIGTTICAPWHRHFRRRHLQAVRAVMRSFGACPSGLIFDTQVYETESAICMAQYTIRRDHNPKVGPRDDLGYTRELRPLY